MNRPSPAASITYSGQWRDSAFVIGALPCPETRRTASTILEHLSEDDGAHARRRDLDLAAKVVNIAVDLARLIPQERREVEDRVGEMNQRLGCHRRPPFAR